MSRNEPVPFIQLINDKFVVCKEGANLLNSVTGKIAVLAVAGPYRTGKSYLLNKIANLDHGFQVGSTVKACTKGIWIWGAPMQISGMEDRYLIMLDTEGLSSFEQAQTNDIQIFSLGILLSSMFLLNTQGTINESALEQLELVVECTKNIRYKDTGAGTDFTANMDELSKQFPHFLWVLRDFVLELADANGNKMSSRDYLESALQPQSSGKHVNEKNRIRRALTSVFPHRDCVTLVRPIMDENDLRNLSKVPVSKLRPEFREQMEALRQKIIQTTPLKRVDQMILNGPSLVKLAEIYVKAMNTGAIPVIHTAWQNVITIQSQEAYENAMQVYQQAMSGFQPNAVYEEKNIEAQHQLARNQALATLRQIAVGDDVTRQQLTDRFLANVEKFHKDFMERNTFMSREMCRQILTQIWNSSGADHVEISNVQQLQEIQRKVEEAYREKAKGPAAQQVLREFFEEKDRYALNNLFQRLQNQMAMLTQVEERANQAKAQFDSLNAQNHATLEENKRLQHSLANLEAENRVLKQTTANLEAEKRNLTSQMEQTVNRSRIEAEELSKKSFNFNEENKRLQQALSNLENESRNLLQKVGMLENENRNIGTQAQHAESRTKAELENISKQNAYVTEENKKLQQSLSNLEIENRSLKSSLNELREKEDEIQRLRNELQNARSEVQTMRNEVEILRGSRALDRTSAAADSRRSSNFHSRPHVYDWNPDADAGVSNDATSSAAATDDANQDVTMEPRLPPGRKAPEQCTIQELKSWLTSLNVDIPQQSGIPKQKFVEMVYENEPALQGYSSPQKSTKKARK